MPIQMNQTDAAAFYREQFTSAIEFWEKIKSNPDIDDISKAIARSKIDWYTARMADPQVKAIMTPEHFVTLQLF
jgi:hypothetical protein